MYARLEDNIVVEILDYDTIEDKFTPQFVAQCVPCDASVEVGMVWDGETFSIPDPIEEALNTVAPLYLNLSEVTIGQAERLYTEYENGNVLAELIVEQL